MSYSCPDFVDDIIKALGVKIPIEDADNPAAQAGLVLERIEDLIDFLRAVSEDCPEEVSRDRFGRINGPTNGEPMRLLARKYKIANGGVDALHRAAMVARNMLEAING